MSPLLLTTACTPQDLSAEVSEQIATVVRVTWRTRGDSEGWVEFGDTDLYGQQTPTSRGSDHEALLLGLHAETEVHFRVVVDGEPGEDQLIQTGSVPNSLPVLVAEGDSWEGLQLVTTAGSGSTLQWVDADGEPSWYRIVPENYRVYRARLASDRQSVLVGAIAENNILGRGQIERYGLDGTLLATTAVAYLAHDFVEIQPGRYGAIQAVQDDLGRWSDQLVEASEDGVREVLWAAAEHFATPVGLDAGESPYNTWTHANALAWDADTGQYILGLRNLSTLVGIDRASHQAVWTIGTTAIEGVPHYRVEDPFEGQHNFQLNGDRLWVFDNGMEDRLYSRVIEYELDRDALTATPTRSYQPDPPAYCYVLGQVLQLDEGRVQAVWSTSGLITDLGPEGEVLWSLRSELAHAFAYGERVESLYP